MNNEIPVQLILLALSIAFIVMYGRMTLYGIKSYWWHKITGKIVDARVISRKVLVRSTRATLWAPYIEYEYHINGNTYVGNNIRFNNTNTTNPANSQKVINKYHETTEVSIFVDQNNPENSVLEPGLYLLPPFIFFSGVLILMAVILHYIGIIYISN